MKTRTTILTVLLLLAMPVAALADYMFKTLDAKNGLTSSQINCILKDSRGYMWFGTPAGLYRFDGYTFRNFQCDSQDGSSLPDSYINSIQEALDGSLWVSTPTGYCLYHPQTESFERDMRQVFAKMGIDRVPTIVYIDKHHNLWGYIPNKGIICYNMQQQLLYEFGYTNDAVGVPQGVVCSISECRDGALIVYEDGRMACCDVMHQQHTMWVTTEIADRRLRHSMSLKAFADQMDNIWLYGQGTLFVYNKTAGLWDTSVGNQLELTGVGVDNSVNGMGGDRSGNIWLGTDRMGLMRMNVNTHEMVPEVPRNMNEYHRNLDDVVRVQSIYVDDTDLVWVGTEKSGAAYTGKNIYRFDTDLLGDITAMTQDKEGRIWYGTSDRGVVGFDGQLASLKVTAMEVTPDGSLWVGSRQNGLTRIKDGVSKMYSVAKDSMKTLIDDHVNALRTDQVGNLWIGTAGGLQIYNPRMNSFSPFTRENGKLPTNNITSLFYTKNKQMLVGTGEGLIIMSPQFEVKMLTGNSTNLKTFTNNYITSIYQDKRGLIWIGTREGVNILDLETDQLSYITEKQGLCNNNICGITEDGKGNLWVTTSNGVSRVVVQRNTEESTFGYGLYNYTTADGLQSNEFNPGSIITRKDGNVLLGGLYGVNWTRQNQSDSNEALSKVMLTQFFIGEEEILTSHVYDQRVLLPQALNETNHIELDNSQNTITIKFAAGNYNQSERLQFMYWMEGLDKDWKSGDALKHSVTFRDLPSGKFTLHVKAVSAEGAVSNQERTLQITVARPWYLQWWMMVLYAVAVVLLLYVWKIGINQVKEAKKKREAVVLELKRQREEIKATADDLRQPMSRMTTIIGNLSEKEKSLEEREQLNTLHSQMLQVITRVSDMQMALENPEEKARSSVQSKYELNAKGEMTLPSMTDDELTSEVRARRHAESPTSKYVIVFIDDNEDFLKFVNSHLRDVYDFHVYNNIHKAADDLEAMKADIVVCKQQMQGMTGSDLCNQLKMDPRTDKTKFVIMTDGVLTSQDMKNQNITMSADNYLAKPFNVNEAVSMFNQLLGLGAYSANTHLIEGAETRMLESRNSSMTTASETMTGPSTQLAVTDGGSVDDEMKLVETRVRPKNVPMQQGGQLTAPETDAEGEDQEDYMGEYSMADSMDRHLLKNIEQYVLQNMSRGTISLEEMATAMGMGRVPFFHKVRSITGKTPAEVIRDMRLKHACVLLKRTNINMSELATNVGFQTGENFITVFKEKFGLSPLEYRLKHRK